MGAGLAEGREHPYSLSFLPHPNFYEMPGCQDPSWKTTELATHLLLLQMLNLRGEICDTPDSIQDPVSSP